MYDELENVKLGLLIALTGLLFGIGMGVAFGVFEDGFKDYVSQGIAAAAPELHDGKSQSKIWRYAQRAHFHSAAIASFSLILIIITAFSNLRRGMKPLVSLLIGLAWLYALSWFAKFYYGPALGRDAASHHVVTQVLALIGIAGLLLGSLILFANLFFSAFAQQAVPELTLVKAGLFLATLGLIFGVGLGIAFNANEEAFKSAVAQGIAAVPGVHDAKSQSKIWRYAQRAHFHGAAIATFSMVLIILLMMSNLKTRLKSFTAILLGMSSAYPLAWFSMFWLAPWIGRDAAHSHILTESLTYVGVGGLLLGALILYCNLFLGWFPEELRQSTFDETRTRAGGGGAAAVVPPKAAPPRQAGGGGDMGGSGSGGLRPAGAVPSVGTGGGGPGAVQATRDQVSGLMDKLSGRFRTSPATKKKPAKQP